NPLFGNQLDHFAAGLAPLFRLVAHRERQMTPVRKRPRVLFFRQRHIRCRQQRLAVRRTCALKRKEQSDLHRCALKVGSVFPPGPAISDTVTIESCIGSLRSDFVLGQSGIGERSYSQEQQGCPFRQIGKGPREEGFLTPQTPFGMTDWRFIRKLCPSPLWVKSRALLGAAHEMAL